MKYIRTADGIYERVMVVRQVCDGKEVAVIKSDKVEFEPITKLADTIEELCDEKVGTFKDKNKPYIYRQTSWSDLKENWTQYHNNVYGAIWTDKGLIYVAKMNDKGELELL